MNVTLRPDLQAFLEEKLRSGQYATAEDVIRAGLAALKQHESFGDFAPGELSELIAEGEKSLDEAGTLDAEEALRLRRADRRRKQGHAR